MAIKTKLFDYLETFKISDPKSFRKEYINPDVDRERKPEKKAKGWQKNTFLQSFSLYPSHYSAYEKKFLMKFDISVFLFLGASFYTKYLDNANIGNAYVSGMKEDLNIVGDSLPLYTTLYSISYAVFQLPMTLLITRPQFSRYLLISCEFIWGMLTLANAFVKTGNQIYPIRFLIGMTEACSFPATYVIFSSFLTDEELFIRAGLYGAFSAAGSASSGALQARALTSLGGVNGLAGWRWQFIIDAVITFGTVIYGFFLFPGIPSSCKKFGLFTEDDMIFARKRLEKKVVAPKKFTTKFLKETFTTWQFYVCVLLWTFHHSSFYTTNGDKLYMKSRPDIYTTAQVNTWDSYMYCVGIPSTVLICPLTQWLGKLPVVTVVFLVAYYACGVLIAYDVPNSLMISAFFLQHLMYDGLSQLFYSWCASLCRDNAEKKAFVLGSMQALSYATNAWVIPLQYNMKDSPRFKAGYIANLVIVFGTNVIFLICWTLSHYDRQLIPKWAGHRHLDESGNMVYLDKADDASDIENVTKEEVSLSDKEKSS
ncbi:DEKNAAC102440 [Brettanomyces naardenensis]|uniref:DEKNAAC102440 n=1 Tax=Brettanomyces naardenensis TaxID=13370 RepID=A0A448YKK3_BRENA|nr:DEKNAAC102440 [Brettanomyces naardenensis]